MLARNRLESFIRSRSEWCISRQRVWGVPIPALHRIDTDDAVMNTETLNHILAVLDEKGVEHWWEGPVEDFVPSSLLEAGRPASETWRKSTDTMDVWFDSGSSWSMLPEMAVGKNAVPGRKFHADICLEGSDQHRGWFQSQLLTAVGSAEDDVPTSPYGTLITHGMVVDQYGKKMSKSLGNIINPLSIVLGGEVCGNSSDPTTHEQSIRTRRRSPDMALMCYVYGLLRLSIGAICPLGQQFFLRPLSLYGKFATRQGSFSAVLGTLQRW